MVRPQRHRLAAGVALTAVLIAFNMGEKNKILLFLPIVEVVALAWAVLDFAELDAYTSYAVMDVGEIAQISDMYAMLGLEFGVQQPALTRTFVENKIARIADPSGMPQAPVNAGLKLPEADFRSYEEKEQAVLAMADEWRSRWGPKVEGWVRTQGVPCRLREFLA